MIGIIVVSHSDVARALVECAEHILGHADGLRWVAIDADDNHDVALQRIRAAIAELEAPKGVLVLTDMFGGTPSNVSLSLLELGAVEVVSGVNMPMLLHAITTREQGSGLGELASNVAASGRKNIIIAGALLSEGASPEPA